MLAWIKDNRLKFLALGWLIVIAYGSMLAFGYDNPLEQAIEWVIQVWTGRDVDLSPEFLQNHPAPELPDH